MLRRRHWEVLCLPLGVKRPGEKDIQICFVDSGESQRQSCAPIRFTVILRLLSVCTCSSSLQSLRFSLISYSYSRSTLATVDTQDRIALAHPTTKATYTFPIWLLLPSDIDSIPVENEGYEVNNPVCAPREASKNNISYAAEILRRRANISALSSSVIDWTTNSTCGPVRAIILESAEALERSTQTFACQEGNDRVANGLQDLC